VGVAILFAVSVLVFAATNVLPGNAARAMLGPYAVPEDIATVEERLGLDEPLPSRYITWLGNMVQGDFGTTVTGSFVGASQESSFRSVRAQLIPRLRNTVILAGLAMAVLIPLGLTLGTVSGLRPGRPVDHVISSVTLGLVAVPEFVVGTLLALLFGVVLGWVSPVSILPVDANPLQQPASLILPVATLVLAAVPYTTRMMRARVAEVAESEYVEMAQLAGIPQRRIMKKYVMRNALAPTAQVIALTLLWFTGGVVIVEAVFAYPGLGQGLVQAVVARDANFVQAVTMVIACMYVVLNIVTDIVVVLLIPKLRTTLW
jgi:peptide/nickel transport system permease protein